MEVAILKKGARPGTKVEPLWREMTTPGMSVLVGKDEEQALHLDARAGRQQLFQSAGARGGEAFEGRINDMNAFMFRQLIQQFEDGALRR